MHGLNFVFLFFFSSFTFMGEAELLRKNPETIKPISNQKQKAAAPESQNGSENFDLQLISPQTQVKKGSDFLIGIHIKIPQDWHSYWSFAGDFGQAPNFKWKPIKNVQIDTLPFPTPKRKSFSVNKQKFYSFIYEKELLIPFKIFIAENYEKDHLSLSLDLLWFVCKEICLSKKTILELDLKVGEFFKTHLENQIIFDFWNKLFPKKFPLNSQFQVKDKHLIINFSFKKRIKCIDLFPQKKEDFSTNSPVLLNQGSDSCSFQIEKTNSNLPKIFGLLVYSEEGEEHSTEFSSYKHKDLALLWFIFLAFLGGLILNVMPCVLPIIFLKFYNTLELRHLSARKILFLNLSYVSGVIFSFLGLAFIILISKQTGESLGWGFHLQSPIFVTFLAALFTLMACYLLNWVSFSAPKISLIFKDERLIPHFVTGVLSTTAASPCTVPFMVSAVGFALSRSSIEVFFIFFFLGLGLSSPYLVLSFFPKTLKYVPSPGAWTENLKKLLSLPLFLTVLWLLWILYLQLDLKIFLFSLSIFPLFLLWIVLQKAVIPLKAEIQAIFKRIVTFIFALLMIVFFIVQRSFYTSYKKDRSSKPTEKSSIGLNWTAFDREKLLFDKQAGKNIFMAFGAEWCLTCKFNERIFETQEFKSLIEDNQISLYYGDWTVRDRKITKFLQSYGQQGVPFYVFLKGEEKIFIFPTLLFKETFLQKIRELLNSPDFI